MNLNPSFSEPYRQNGILAIIVSILIHASIVFAWISLNKKPPVLETPARVIEVQMFSPKASPKSKPEDSIKPVAEPVVKPAVEPLVKKLEKPKPVLKPKPRPEPMPEAEPTPRPDPTAPAVSAPVQAAPAPAPVTFTEASYKSPGLHNPPTRYPRIALERQWEGSVVLRVQVLASGLPGEIKLERSSGHDILDEATLDQVKEWHFIPAQKNNQPTESWVIVPIEFRLKH